MEALNEQQYPLVKLVLEQALEPELVRVQELQVQALVLQERAQAKASAQVAKLERLELRAQSLVQVAELARLEPLAQV